MLPGSSLSHCMLQTSQCYNPQSFPCVPQQCLASSTPLRFLMPSKYKRLTFLNRPCGFNRGHTPAVSVYLLPIRHCCISNWHKPLKSIFWSILDLAWQDSVYFCLLFSPFMKARPVCRESQAGRVSLSMYLALLCTPRTVTAAVDSWHVWSRPCCNGETVKGCDI